MNDLQKARYILSSIERLFPNAQTELKNWNIPFQFLICILLSAQTTDKQVNNLTPMLFLKYPYSKDFAKSSESEIEKYILGVNYYQTKAKHILKTAKIIEEKYNGEVPKTVDELMELPGVGYKTANVFLNDLYKANQGIAVDTHVMRVAQRLGLTTEKDPNKIAKDLETLYPKEDWWKINRYFVLYGRYICRANMHKSNCIFKDICSYCKNLPSE
ncbi:endonuclease III [Candidatus Dojkabacteria bacterium]|jgi:endonuclease-3|nr:endonuclease III [Candidatus Dojkabacteria bacterium]